MYSRTPGILIERPLVTMVAIQSGALSDNVTVTAHRPGEIALEVVQVRMERREPNAARAPWLFAAAMAASVAVAVTAGIVLGFLAAVQAWFGESNCSWSDGSGSSWSPSRSNS